MAKQLNVDLRFNADVSAAKAQLQGLQTSINQLTTSMATQGAQLGITPKIQEAQQAAVQLKTALSQSMNVETGKFDLSKFNSSLKSMNTDLGKLKTQLVNLGPSGQQTFMTLAQSIMTAEIPTKRISASLAALGTTLKNTAKWQLSSSMLHGFMSAVQTSYRYAQDLNTSLNNIRIVTGESAEAMDKFAARANKAAKALSASTLDYTDAALIFYQQGLQGKEVEERAEITLKMANVSRQSAEIVSDQLTAVWNNFANGTDSLESFADKMVALGAATASSSDEIAGGLEKFAAIGETIGLSFDYAAAALATITSNTRQSEEVVGTALKTIFARIQGLKLGETLEDGTTLNKYSQALETVGVHIYNANGGLKNMDTILDETAAKWNTLTDDQQAALAQTVAGIRQYNQFIALMDNWESKGVGDKDSMKANLETINESTGALQEQADTYAESWEAASKRVKASAEEVYMDLLDDDFFIDLTNGLADFLGLLDNLLDSMGGARGLLTGLSSILLNMFAGSAAKGLENMVYNFRSFIGLTEKEAMSTKQRVMSEVRGIVTSTNTSGKPTQQQGAYFTGMEGQLTLQESLLGVQDKLNDSEKLQAKYIMEQNAAYAHQVELLGLAADKAKDKAKNAEDKFIKNIDKASLNSSFGEEYSNKISEIGNAEDVVANMRQMYFGTDNSIGNAIGATSIKEFKFDQERTDSSKMTAAIDKYIQELTEAAQELEGIDTESQLAQKMREYANALDERKKALVNSDGTNKPGANEGFKNIIKDIQDDTGGNQRKLDLMREQSITDYGKNRTRIDVEDLEGQDLEEANKLNRKLSDSVDDVVTGFKEEAKTSQEASEGVKNLGKNTEESEKQIKGLGNTTKKWSQTMVGVAQSAMSLSFAISSLNSLKNTWADETIGTGEKLLQTFMSLGMAIPMLINGINGLKTAYMGSATVQGALNLVTQTRIGLQQQDIATMTAEELHQKTKIGLEQAQIAITNAKIVQKTQELATTGANIAAMTAEELAEKTGMTTKQAGIIISALKNKANLTEALSEAGLAGSKTAGAIATKIATIANWGFLASMTPLLAITLVLAAAIAALALIIGGVTAAFKAIANNTPEAKLKAAKEESKALTEQLNQTKQAAEDLKSAFKDYDSIQEELAKCTKGTEEWNEALQKNNQHVLDMLDKFPELAKIPGAIKIGADGQLIIDEGAREEATRMANDRVATATIAANAGKQKVRDMEIEQLQKDVDKKATRTETTYTYTGQSGTNYDRSYTTSTQKVDTNVKKILEATANRYGTNNINATNVSEIIQAMKDSKQLDVNLDDSKLIEQTMSLANSEQELMVAVQANTVATQAETAASGASVMAGNEEYEKSDYKGLIAAIVGANGFDQDITLDETQAKNLRDYGTGAVMSQEDLAAQYKEAITDENNLAATFTLGIGKFSSGRAQDTFKQYTDLMGLDQNKMQDIDFRNDGIYYKAIDENGVVSDKETKIDFNTIANTLAADASKGNAIEYGEAISKQMNSFENKDQAEIFAAAATGNSGLLSEELLAKNQEDIDKIVESMEISQDTLDKMGFEAKDFVDETGGMEKATKKAQEAFKKYQKEVVNSKKGFNDLKKNGKTALEAIASEGKKVFNEQGEKVGEWSAETIQAAQEISTNLSKALGADGDLGLDADFIAKNKGIIDDFINDVDGSGERLKTALQEDAIVDIQAKFEGDEEIRTKLGNLHTELLNMTNQDWTIGVDINDANFLAKCQEIVSTAQMTQAEAVAYFGKMGFDVTGHEEEIPVENNKEVSWMEYVDPSDPYKGLVKKTETVGEKGTQKVFALETITPNGSFGGNIDKINNGSGVTTSPETTDDGTINPKDTGGSKSTPKDKTFKEKDKKEAKKYEDEFDRYYDITQALEEYNRELEETQERKDELWGADKLAAMDAEKKKLGEITAKQKEYIKAISGEDGKGGYLAQDREALAAIGGVFDEEGRLTNYEELTQKWLNDLNAAQNTWNQGMENATNTFNANKKSEGADEAYDTTKTGLDDALESAEDAYEKNKSILEKWKETYNLNEEEKQKLEDYLRQMRQLNYEELEHKLEIRVELNENDIADIEHQLERLGDNNVYASAERIALIEKNAASYRNIADAQMKAIKEAETLYQQYLTSDGKEGISKEDYMARLQEGKEALQEAEMSIRDGIVQIGDELENTFDLVDEKLDRQFTKFDRLIELMDHYKNIISLTEGEASYKEFNKILRASQEVLRDRIEADKSEVAMWENRRKQLEADIATLPENSPAKREAEEALQVIMEKEADAKSQLMADIEQLGEYAREIFENSIEQAMKDFEDEMFGRPLNSIIESIEMMNSRQEELLTTTNKIYETNKLIRNVEKDIEATTNNRAKQAYLEFQNKVKQKQEQNELTKFELDLLTAEYEMTKAQIALEEAQNAKDTVRLTRDAEGNYGYVYTANEDKVADAEQALDDATNNYYNTALDGAQKYQDQIYQHIQEWEEKVKEVYLDQTLSEEEKNKKIKEINDIYNTLITQDKNLYYMAVGAMQESAYNTQVDYDLKGIKSAENWFDECDGFLSDLEDAQDEYDSNTEEVSDHTEENFGKMSTAIRNTKQESEYLKDQIVDELVPELDTTLKDSIDNATEAWWKYIEALQEVIRLTDEAMQKNSDEKYYSTIDDYSQEIYDKIKSGDYTEEELQNLMDRRWKKMGGKDNYDYASLMGTRDSTWDQVFNMLRDYKIENTDWMGLIQEGINNGAKLNEIQWMIDIRDKKVGKKETLELAKSYAESIGATLATGGYTGDWGPEGKLAVLHEKELVLNAQDTENFLSATNILREISQMLDRDALIASLGAINLRAMTLNSPADQVLQQEVTIHADFPNVTDHNEIELAIDNLINAASQHAYRT